MTVFPMTTPPPQTDAETPVSRLPPHNIEAEQAILGALLYDNRLLDRVEDRLKSEHFYHPAHQRIFRAINTLVSRGQIATPVTLKSYFEADGDLSHIGGAGYLMDLAAGVLTTAGIGDFADTVRDLYLRRQLIVFGDEIVFEANRHDLNVTAQNQIEGAEQKLYNIATQGDSEGRGFKAFNEALALAIQTAQLAYQREGKITGVTSGFRDVDGKLGGLHKSDLLILAGRPSMGKTALATNMAFRAARAHMYSTGEEGAPVAIFSLEMSSEQLAGRILADITEISGHKIREGRLEAGDLPKFIAAAAEMEKLPLYIDDTPALSIAQVRQRCRRLQRSKGLGFIIVDYLQLLRGSDSNADNRVQEISEITRGLKALAKELNVPVLALSQLSRAVEQRDDKRPQLSDLRESGSIEQDADVVMFVFREQYYLERAEPSQKPEEDQAKFNDRYERWRTRLNEVYNTAEVIIAKQRHGPIGTVRLFFDGDLTRFDNLDTTYAIDDHE